MPAAHQILFESISEDRLFEHERLWVLFADLAHFGKISQGCSALGWIVALKDRGNIFVALPVAELVQKL